MAIFVSQGEAKSQFRQIFKSQNLTQFLRFGPKFLHVTSISIEVQSLNCNMLPNITPSLISKGGYQIPPPPSAGRNGYPVTDRVKLCLYLENPVMSTELGNETKYMY